jgi:hypothetical protein
LATMLTEITGRWSGGHWGIPPDQPIAACPQYVSSTAL